jgi:hypothetical protein
MNDDYLNKIIEEGEKKIIQSSEPKLEVLNKVYKLLTKNNKKNKLELLQELPIYMVSTNPIKEGIELVKKISKLGIEFVRLGTDISRKYTYFIEVEFIRFIIIDFIPKKYIKNVEKYKDLYLFGRNCATIGKPLDNPESWNKVINNINQFEKFPKIKEDVIKSKKSYQDILKKMKNKYLLGGILSFDNTVKPLDTIIIHIEDKVKGDEIPNLLPPFEIKEIDKTNVIIFTLDDCISYFDDYISPFYSMYILIGLFLTDIYKTDLYNLKLNYKELTEKCMGITANISLERKKTRSNDPFYINYTIDRQNVKIPDFE